MRYLVTGGAGFIGSALCNKLVEQGNEVLCLDNFFTGRKSNIKHLLGSPDFEIIRHDITLPIYLEVDRIYHLACPASPVHYQYNPVKTIKTNVIGTHNMLGLAKRVNARFLLASTSEVYGDPSQTPQKEEYWGHVNPVGPRSCYDEGKRVAESLSVNYGHNGVDVRIARIFNTFGPYMTINDGRVISNFITSAIKGDDLYINGDGSQTRSFMFIDDLVDGLMKMMKYNYANLPVNLGNPDNEISIFNLANLIIHMTGSKSKIQSNPQVPDDPTRRRPDVTRAKQKINWEPKVPLREGLEITISYFENILKAGVKVS